ncbi:phosphoketolase family protein [Patescibacteria group bacterium]|nr:phosphoketolase family protein [Patescibacteria group bacterium]
MPKKYEKEIRWLKDYLRFVDYMGVAQLYLKGNFLLKEPLQAEHVKDRVLGHWGTVPGLNFIYANLNWLVCKEKCEVLFVTGPGHGAPANLANLFVEGSLYKVYSQYSVDEKGFSELVHDFSWPFTPFPSHVTPTVPGSILEGGELGYSLATAYGAALDNPNLIVAAVVGDGEAETGPLSAAWNGNKFLDPKKSGAVLPILHVNGYKISNPTMYGMMDNKEVTNVFTGFGYDIHIVEGSNIEEKMMAAIDDSYKKIRAIQKKARSSKKPVLKPKWPMIFLRSPKGWRGIKEFGGKPIENSFRAHGVPIEGLQKDDVKLKAVEKWLLSYKIGDFFDDSGRIKKEIFEFVPKGNYSMGRCKHAVGGNVMKALNVPNLKNYEVKFKKRGSATASSMNNAGKFLRDMFVQNKDNFRMFCPDEMVSNKLETVFEATNRAYQWPLLKNVENTAPDGRVMEVLSEHNLQGWMQGYLLTGRYGIFVSYEAFTTIISSMVDQFAKFLKQSFKVSWRKPIPSAIYIQSSVGWRQEHNGYSHQNPSFVSSMLMKHGEFTQIFYPSDANSMLVALEESLLRKNGICVIVAGKRDLGQWLTVEEARKQSRDGMGVWEWVTGAEATKNPDVVLASAGDYMTEEALMAVKVCKDLVPELKIRFVNVSELSGLCVGDFCNIFTPRTLTRDGFEKFFTKDKPVVFNYHGYTNDIQHIIWEYADVKRFSLHGYSEEGSTTTPFDMAIRNKVDRYHLAMDLIERGAKRNARVAKKMSEVLQILENKISDHHNYICEFGDDPPEIKGAKW